MTAGEPLLPIKEKKLQPAAEGRKEVICNTKTTLQKATYPACPSLRITAGAPGEKTQNPN
jgi:hypothetical protein